MRIIETSYNHYECVHRIIDRLIGMPCKAFCYTNSIRIRVCFSRAFIFYFSHFVGIFLLAHIATRRSNVGQGEPDGGSYDGVVLQSRKL